VGAEATAGAGEAVAEGEQAKEAQSGEAQSEEKSK